MYGPVQYRAYVQCCMEPYSSPQEKFKSGLMFLAEAKDGATHGKRTIQ